MLKCFCISLLRIQSGEGLKFWYYQNRGLRFIFWFIVGTVSTVSGILWDVPGVVHLGACHSPGRTPCQPTVFGIHYRSGGMFCFSRHLGNSGTLSHVPVCSGTRCRFGLPSGTPYGCFLGFCFPVVPGFSDERDRKYNPSIPLGFLAFRSYSPIWDTFPLSRPYFYFLSKRLLPIT